MSEKKQPPIRLDCGNCGHMVGNHDQDGTFYPCILETCSCRNFIQADVEPISESRLIRAYLNGYHDGFTRGTKGDFDE